MTKQELDILIKYVTFYDEVRSRCDIVTDDDYINIYYEKEIEVSHNDFKTYIIDKDHYVDSNDVKYEQLAKIEQFFNEFYFNHIFI